MREQEEQPLSAGSKQTSLRARGPSLRGEGTTATSPLTCQRVEEEQGNTEGVSLPPPPGHFGIQRTEEQVLPSCRRERPGETLPPPCLGRKKSEFKMSEAFKGEKMSVPLSGQML